MFFFGPPDVKKMANRGDVSGLLKAARHKDPSLRSKAVEALGSISFGKQENVSLQYASILVLALLTLARNDNSAQVRQTAVRSLGDIYTDLRLVLKGLLEGFLLSGHKRRPDLGDFAATALPRIEFELEAALKQDPDLSVRKTAAESLSRKWGFSRKPADTDDIAPYFYIALQEWNKCAKMGPAAVEPLISILEDKDVHVVISAIRTLARIGDARAIDALERVLQSSTDQGIKEAARKALRKFEKSGTTTSTTLADVLEYGSEVKGADALRSIVVDTSVPANMESARCPAYSDGKCVNPRTQENTGPCSWNPDNWVSCSVAQLHSMWK